MRARGLGGIIAAVIASLLLSACNDDDSGADTDAALTAAYEVLLSEGNEAGMSANQADILERAIAEARPVTFEEYKSAVEERITCIEDLGFAIAERREIPHAGWTEIAFLYGGLPSGEVRPGPRSNPRLHVRTGRDRGTQRNPRRHHACGCRRRPTRR